MSKCCVYMVNQHPLYMNMAYQSVTMLRRHSKVPVRLFLITDAAQSTFTTERIFPGLDITLDAAALNTIGETLVRKMTAMDVDVRVRTPHPAEPTFVHTNQSYMATECPEDIVFFLDADTFVFDDIERVMDDYSDCDVVAMAARWPRREPAWKPEWFNHATPLTTCLMLFRNGTAARWGEFLPAMCCEYAEGASEISRWIRQTGIMHLREELSLTPFVIRNGLRWQLFKDEHCGEIRDGKTLSKSVVCHTFAYNWTKAYRTLTNGKDLPLLPKAFF